MNVVSTDKPAQLVLVLVVIGVALAYFTTQGPGGLGMGEEVVLENQSMLTEDRQARIQQKAQQYERAREITNPSGYINTDNVSIKNLVGEKVILLDMWTYTCINCQRTLPYLTAWHEKYGDHGLVIIGNHAPEFEFEKKRTNVENAVNKFGIEYPVVLDNNYGTWRAYNNRYWPQKYLIGVDGFVRYEHIGEGSYTETEHKIQELLRERNEVLGIDREVPGGTVNPDADPVGGSGVGTPEIYFGAWRNNLLANGQPQTVGVQNLSDPEQIDQNKLYLTGSWNIQREYAENTAPGAEIILKYRASKVNMVMRADEPVDVTVTRDGEWLGVAGGTDIVTKNGESHVTVQEDRLYNIVDDPNGSGVHTLTITVNDPGLEAFTFTFG